MNRSRLNLDKRERSKKLSILQIKNNKRNNVEAKLKASKEIKADKVGYEKQVAENDKANTRAFWN